MSKILLIKARFLDDFWLQPITQPIGLLYIGAMLMKAGHETKLHDCAIDYSDLHLLKRTISEWKPDFVGISMIITEIESTKRIMAMIDEMLPDVTVTFGGPWPTANPEESIMTFGADFVVLGEGEFVFPQLINAINNGLPTESIPGTASLNDGKVKINERRYLTGDELNSLPFPAWDLLDQEIYSRAHSMANVGCRPYMAILTSRGCPFRCVYCHQTMGKIFRMRSAESVLAEMKILRNNYGIKDFEIVDDCFNLNRKRMLEILSGIRDKIADARLHLPNGIRSDMLESEDMALLKQAGVLSMAFAIETASPRLQAMIHKNLNLEKAARMISAAVNAGIYSTGFFMIGFPTETNYEAYESVEFALRSPLHRAVFQRPIPFAGTELAELVKTDTIKRMSLSNPHVVCYHTSNVNISAMSDSLLHKTIREAYRRFYMSPKRIVGLINMAMRHPFLFSAYRIFKMFFYINAPMKK